MIIFTVPKPFKGEFAIIQENAIDSWLAFKPKPRIIMLGDEVGMSTFAKRKRIEQIKNIQRNKQSTPILSDIFAQVQKIDNEEVFMYINADIVLLNSPAPSIEVLANRFKKFLAIGRRYEMQVKRKMSSDEILSIAQKSCLKQKSWSWMDYFIFTKDVFDLIPPFALGKTFWDKWLVWMALQKGIPTVDITSELFAVHQTHSYSMSEKANMKTVWAGEEALENLRLAGGWSHGATVKEASYTLVKGMIYPQKKREIPIKRSALDRLPFLWPLFLRIRLMREKYSSIVDK